MLFPLKLNKNKSTGNNLLKIITIAFFVGKKLPYRKLRKTMKTMVFQGWKEIAVKVPFSKLDFDPGSEHVQLRLSIFRYQSGRIF